MLPTTRYAVPYFHYGTKPSWSLITFASRVTSFYTYWSTRTESPKSLGSSYSFRFSGTLQLGTGSDEWWWGDHSFILRSMYFIYRKRALHDDHWFKDCITFWMEKKKSRLLRVSSSGLSLSCFFKRLLYQTNAFRSVKSVADPWSCAHCCSTFAIKDPWFENM